jgi:soluble lytic murein transglycosylase-like protein
MRVVLVLAILWLGLSSAAPEPEYSSLLFSSFYFVEASPPNSLVEIETSAGKGDRLVVAALAPPAQLSEIELTAASQVSGTAGDNPDSEPLSPPRDPDPAIPLSLGELCNALLTSAQDNNLPVPFFANLIWQESGLQKDAVSAKGAMGIAQFMPETAAEHGLGDPFEPMQAISASARLLRELRHQFGNLGFVAAAYNAGPRRVSEWLARRRRLPRETLNYVVNVTGRSVEAWQKTPPDDAALRFVQRLPCRDLSAFAALEQSQPQQADEKPRAPDGANTATRPQQNRLAGQNHHPRNLLREAIRASAEAQTTDKHEAKEHGRRAMRDRHGRA